MRNVKALAFNLVLLTACGASAQMGQPGSLHDITPSGVPCGVTADGRLFMGERVLEEWETSWDGINGTLPIAVYESEAGSLYVLGNSGPFGVGVALVSFTTQLMNGPGLEGSQSGSMLTTKRDGQLLSEIAGSVRNGDGSIPGVYGYWTDASTESLFSAFTFRQLELPRFCGVLADSAVANDLASHPGMQSGGFAVGSAQFGDTRRGVIWRLSSGAPMFVHDSVTSLVGVSSHGTSIGIGRDGRAKVLNLGGHAWDLLAFGCMSSTVEPVWISESGEYIVGHATGWDGRKRILRWSRAFFGLYLPDQIVLAGEGRIVKVLEDGRGLGSDKDGNAAILFQ